MVLACPAGTAVRAGARYAVFEGDFVACDEPIRYVVSES